MLESSQNAGKQHSLKLRYQGNQIAPTGFEPLLEDVSPEVFVSHSSDDALILGVDSANGAAAMYDIALGKASF